MAEYFEQNIEDVKNYVPKRIFILFGRLATFSSSIFLGLVEVSWRETFGYSCSSKRGIRKLDNFEVDTMHYSTVHQ
jgi:hypothetical protein